MRPRERQVLVNGHLVLGPLQEFRVKRTALKLRTNPQGKITCVPQLLEINRDGELKHVWVQSVVDPEERMEQALMACKTENMRLILKRVLKDFCVDPSDAAPVIEKVNYLLEESQEAVSSFLLNDSGGHGLKTIDQWLRRLQCEVRPKAANCETAFFEDTVRLLLDADVGETAPGRALTCKDALRERVSVHAGPSG